MHIANVVSEFFTFALHLIQKIMHLLAHIVDVFFGQEATVDYHRATVRDAGRGQACIAFLLHRFTAMNRVYVKGGVFRPFRNYRQFGAAFGQRGEQSGFHFLHHCAHMAHGAITKERHGAVGDAAMCFDFSPPNTAMAKAYTIFMEGFGNDDVLHTLGGEKPLLGQVGDTTETAGFFVCRARYFDSPRVIRPCFDKRLDCDDGGGEAAFHIARAAPIYFAVFQFAAERVECPALADFDHVNVGVEMHTLAGMCAFTPRNYVPTGVFVAVAGGAVGADQLNLEAPTL